MQNNRFEAIKPENDYGFITADEKLTTKGKSRLNQVSNNDAQAYFAAGDIQQLNK